MNIHLTRHAKFELYFAGRNVCHTAVKAIHIRLMPCVTRIVFAARNITHMEKRRQQRFGDAFFAN